MRVIKANSSISTIFTKLIHTMGENVEWTKFFLIHDNSIILLGKKRSLIFNFDNKRVFGNYLDLSINEQKAEEIIDNTLLEDTLNLILYIFGKWGEIKGLRVEKDYNQLNAMINRVLSQVDVEGIASQDNSRFFHNGKRTTYEEVITLIFEKAKQNAQKEKESPDEEIADKKEDKIGLWHKIIWGEAEEQFEKRKIENFSKKRLGHNFYIVKYQCSSCGQNLFMTVYPEGKEYRIETKEEPVYMARVYTCSNCHRFYTPKPERMLIEGLVYEIDFEEDKNAYEDYLSLLGEHGERTVNSHFNQYESQYYNRQKASQKNKPQRNLEILENLEGLPDSTITDFLDRIDSGFMEVNDYPNIYERVEKELQVRKKRKEVQKKQSDRNFQSVEKKADKRDVDIIDTIEKVEHIHKNNKIENTGEFNFIDETVDRRSTSYKVPKKIESEELNNKKRNSKEYFLTKKENEKESQTEYMEMSENSLRGKKNDSADTEIKAENLSHIIEKVKEKSYFETVKIMEDYKKRSKPSQHDVKYTAFLTQMEEILKRKGKKELDYISANIPFSLSRKQYDVLREKIQEYRGLDLEDYLDKLEKVYETSEKAEIETYIKKAGARDRKSLLNLHDKLKQMNFLEKNVIPYLEDLREKVFRLDAQQIEKICPEPADLSFEEGMEIYKKIKESDWLPEIKTSYMDKINQRLIKIKMDESELLVRKLEKELGDLKEKTGGLYLCDIRRLLRDNGDTDTVIIGNALNTYGYGKGEYEFPIFTLDTSNSGNGKEGFTVTPDHIFYNGLIRSGVLKIQNVQAFSYESGLLKGGVYVSQDRAEKVKVCGVSKLDKKNIPGFLTILNQFLQYLKEKPESRNISYLSKENHTKICCFRCGYVYVGKSKCPKCGSTNLIN